METATKETAALVAYEVSMMRLTAIALGELQAERATLEQAYEGQWQLENNAFLESFLVHYRNVMDFLSPRDSRKPHDVTAGPFLGEGHGYRHPGTPLRQRADIDTFLSHISVRRGDGSKDWRFGEMVSEIEQALNDFAGQLDVETLRWFESPAPRPDMPPSDGFTTSS